METPRQHLFALAKNEQRVVVLIMIALLAFALVKFYYGLSHRPKLPPAGTAAPASSPVEEEPAADDAR